jgi:hypothetical protein
MIIKIHHFPRLVFYHLLILRGDIQIPSFLALLYLFVFPIHHLKDLNFLVVKYLHHYSVPTDLFPALFNLQVIYLDNYDRSPLPCRHYSIPLHLVLLPLPLLALQMSHLVVSNLLITMLWNLLRTIRKCQRMVAQHSSCQRQQ